jgi:hypothetical protein
VIVADRLGLKPSETFLAPLVSGNYTNVRRCKSTASGSTRSERSGGEERRVFKSSSLNILVSSSKSVHMFHKKKSIPVLFRKLGA